MTAAQSASCRLFSILSSIAPIAVLSLSVLSAQEEPPNARALEARLLTGVSQLTVEGRRAGEGYYAHDAQSIVFQSEREPDNPFYQIYWMDLTNGDVERISPGSGKTTCAWIHPTLPRVMFASTHGDPDSLRLQKEELDFRASGQTRRYAWDYDENFDIWVRDRESGDLTNVTNARGYDAEGSYSPDGRRIAFSSNRHAYSETLPERDRELLKVDKSVFLDLYIMDADGSNVKRLTKHRGYDGGPFFSPDGSRLCFRRFSEDGLTAEVFTIATDGSDERQLTQLGAMSWAPFFHPSGEYLIFTTNRHGFTNFELYLVDVEGLREPVRVTFVGGFDGLPTFTPDGRTLAWTSSRTKNGSAQIFRAQWNHDSARGMIAASPLRAGRTEALPTPMTSAPITSSDLRTYAGLLRLPIFAAGNAEAAVHLRAAGRAWMERLGLSVDPARGSIEAPNVLGTLQAAPEFRSEPAVLVGVALGDKPDSDGVPALGGLLEIAEFLGDRLQSGKFTPRRNVVFVALGGDAGGAGGARAWISGLAGNGKAPSASVAAFLRCDLSEGGSEQPRLAGVATSPTWRTEIERRNVPFGLAFDLVESLDAASPAAAFLVAGVPVLDLRRSAKTGSATDLIRFTAAIVQSLAQSKDAPVFVPPTTAASSPNRTVGAPWLGTIPDYARTSIRGMTLSGVVPGGPAATAGLKEGDVIVEMAGTTVLDIYSYKEALDVLQPGRTIRIVVVRDGQRREFDVTPRVRD